MQIRTFLTSLTVVTMILPSFATARTQSRYQSYQAAAEGEDDDQSGENEGGDDGCDENQGRRSGRKKQKQSRRQEQRRSGQRKKLQKQEEAPADDAANAERQAAPAPRTPSPTETEAGQPPAPQPDARPELPPAPKQQVQRDEPKPDDRGSRRGRGQRQRREAQTQSEDQQPTEDTQPQRRRQRRDAQGRRSQPKDQAPVPKANPQTEVDAPVATGEQPAAPAPAPQPLAPPAAARPTADQPRETGSGVVHNTLGVNIEDDDDQPTGATVNSANGEITLETVGVKCANPLHQASLAPIPAPAPQPRPEPQKRPEPPPRVTAPAPAPAPAPRQPAQVIGSARSHVLALAGGSQCAKQNWSGRGRAPVGYTKGVTLSFARTLCRAKSPRTPAGRSALIGSNGDNIAGLIGSSVKGSKDALAHYAGQIPGVSRNPQGAEAIRAIYTLGYGLGMRESSGKWCEGEDMSARRGRGAQAIEAGVFQTSYDSLTNSAQRALFAEYKSASKEKCQLDVWSEGVSSCSSRRVGNSGGSEAAKFQHLSKVCPAFAAEYAMATLRTLRNHYGPVNTRAAQATQSCANLVRDVEKYINEDTGRCAEFL